MDFACPDWSWDWIRNIHFPIILIKNTILLSKLLFEATTSFEYAVQSFFQGEVSSPVNFLQIYAVALMDWIRLSLVRKGQVRKVGRWDWESQRWNRTNARTWPCWGSTDVAPSLLQLRWVPPFVGLDQFERRAQQRDLLRRLLPQELRTARRRLRPRRRHARHVLKVSFRATKTTTKTKKQTQTTPASSPMRASPSSTFWIDKQLQSTCQRVHYPFSYIFSSPLVLRSPFTLSPPHS